MSRLLTVFAIALAGCSGSPKSSAISSADRNICDTPIKNPESVSIAALIGNPERFEGRPVRVIGFYHGSFEHSAIYLNQADFQHQVAPNGLWVANTVPSNLNNKYIALEGIFTSKSRGHMSLWSGMICGVTRAASWANEP